MGLLNGLKVSAADKLSGGALSRMVDLAESNRRDLGHSQAYTAHLSERLVELEGGLLGAGGDGWVALDEMVNGKQFSREGLRAMHRLGLLFYLKNPIIKRGVKVQSGYVFGLGVSVRSPHVESNRVLQLFHDDIGNRRALTDPAKQVQREEELHVVGNLVFVFFTNRATGAVQVRLLDIDEIAEVLCNPDDKDEPWYYKRVFVARVLDASTGKMVDEKRTEYYPDWHYNPPQKLMSIGGDPVHWDRPVYHVKGATIGTMPIAPSELFAQLDWARSYNEFLEHRLSVAASLSKFVHKITTATKGGIAKAKERVATTFARPGVMPNKTGATEGDAGGAAFAAEGANIDTMSVKGATINPEEGRRYLLMVCAGFGFPETFFGDASVGSLATAKSLDQPTEIAMEARRLLWKTVREDFARFVLVAAARAPLNPFSKIARVVYNGQTPTVEVKNKDGQWEAVYVDVDYPSLLEHDIKARVDAVNVAAPFLERIPKLVARLMLTALGEDDIDETLELLPDVPTDVPGVPPPAPPNVPPGKAPLPVPLPAPPEPGKTKSAKGA